jgi:putative aldouronate transport system substrate-binding protein
MCHWADEGFVSEAEAMKETNDQTIQSKDWAVSWWTDIPNNAEADGRYGQACAFAPVTEHWAHTNSTLGSCYAVSSHCDEATAKACVEFLGWLFSDNTVASLYTYGIEGKDYDLDANGQVVKKGDMYNHSMWESTSALALDTLEAGEPVNKKDLYEAFNGSAIGSEAAGFLFDSAPVNDIITACNERYDEIGFALENGGFKESEVEAKIAELQAKLDASGYQDLLAEAQRQYNAWKNQ